MLIPTMARIRKKKKKMGKKTRTSPVKEKAGLVGWLGRASASMYPRTDGGGQFVTLIIPIDRLTFFIYFFFLVVFLFFFLFFSR